MRDQQVWYVLSAEAGLKGFGILEVAAAGRLGACRQGWLGKKAEKGWDKLGKWSKQNRTWSLVR